MLLPGTCPPLPPTPPPRDPCWWCGGSWGALEEKKYKKGSLHSIVLETRTDFVQRPAAAKTWLEKDIKDPIPKRNLVKEWRIPPQRKSWVGKRNDITEPKVDIKLFPPPPTTRRTTRTVLGPDGFAAGKKKVSRYHRTLSQYGKRGLWLYGTSFLFPFFFCCGGGGGGEKEDKEKVSKTVIFFSVP